MPWNNSQFIACTPEYDEAKIILFGAPFDSTTSNRPGARFAPGAIRTESYGLETFSPYQNRDLVESPVFDDGDLEFPFGDPSVMIKTVHEQTEKILKDEKIPLLIGGEHLVSLGAIRAAADAHPNLHLIHFDAHADLRDAYLGASLSHASVIRRAWDRLGDGRIHQFGIRSGDSSEFSWAENGHVSMARFGFDGLESALQSIGNAPVYLSIDLDVLDPAIFPGTGTPEAGGVSFMELLSATLSVIRKTRLIACDVVELAPNWDASNGSTATAAKLLREMMIGIGNAQYKEIADEK